MVLQSIKCFWWYVSVCGKICICPSRILIILTKAFQCTIHKWLFLKATINSGVIYYYAKFVVVLTICSALIVDIPRYIKFKMRKLSNHVQCEYICSECVRGVSGVSQDTPIFQDLLYEIHQKNFQKFYVLR